MRVVARFRKIGGITGIVFTLPFPVPVRSTAGRIVKIVVQGCRMGFRRRVTIEKNILSTGIENVVFKGVVGGIPLNLEFAFAGLGGVVVVKRVVHDVAVVGA